MDRLAAERAVRLPSEYRLMVFYHVLLAPDHRKFYRKTGRNPSGDGGFDGLPPVSGLIRAKRVHPLPSAPSVFAQESLLRNSLWNVGAHQLFPFTRMNLYTDSFPLTGHATRGIIRIDLQMRFCLQRLSGLSNAFAGEKSVRAPVVARYVHVVEDPGLTISWKFESSTVPHSGLVSVTGSAVRFGS